jgi:hypothetical protein
MIGQHATRFGYFFFFYAFRTAGRGAGVMRVGK